MNALAGYIGTTQTIAAGLVACISILVILVILSLIGGIKGMMLFFAMLVVMALFTVTEWLPMWIFLTIFFITLVFLFFGSEMGARFRG